jgi:hypothetical protein
MSKGIPYKLIVLDKERKLRFGMGAIVEFEQLTGHKLMELDNNTPPDVVIKAAWVMLKQEDKELTLEKTCELIDEHYEGTVKDFIEDIQEAVLLAFPAPEGDEKNG